MQGLSIVEQQTLEWLRIYVAGNGFAPSRHEMELGLGVTSTAIQGRLNRLERKGYIRRRPNASRALVLLVVNAQETEVVG